jgi:hypothetical protein
MKQLRNDLFARCRVPGTHTPVKLCEARFLRR